MCMYVHIHSASFLFFFFILDNSVVLQEFLIKDLPHSVQSASDFIAIQVTFLNGMNCEEQSYIGCSQSAEYLQVFFKESNIRIVCVIYVFQNLKQAKDQLIELSLRFYLKSVENLLNSSLAPEIGRSIQFHHSYFHREMTH